MPQPTIIIEIQNGKLDLIYSNTDISFLIIDRDTTAPEATVTFEHFKPTLVKADLTKLYPDEPEIVAALKASSEPPTFY